MLSTPAGLERLVRDASVPRGADPAPGRHAAALGGGAERIFRDHGQVDLGPPLGPDD